MGLKNGYALARCMRCLHLFSTTLASDEDLETLYHAYCYDEMTLARVSPALRRRFRDMVRPWARYRQHNRLLDVGFGAGALLQAATQEGWTTYGVERSSVAVEQGRRHELGDLQVCDFLCAPYDTGFFDVICMLELIEHLIDPMPFLQQAERLLRPGGLLYLTTPNAAGLNGRLLGTAWSVVAPPEHVQLFSLPSMLRTLRGAGFKPEAVYTEGFYPFELLRHWWPRRTVPTASAVQTPTRQQLNEAVQTSRGGRWLKRAVNSMMRATGLGDTLKVAARKPVA